MEKAELITKLENVFEELIQNISTFDEDQFNIVPFEGSWTAGQLAKHLEKSHNGFLEIITGPVTEADRAPDLLAKTIKEDFLDYSIKATSPDFVLPPEAIYRKEVLISSLEAIKLKLIEAVETLDLTKKCLAFEIPYYGFLTRLEAVYFVIYHTKRHISIKKYL
jgi:hypothetical protein